VECYKNYLTPYYRVGSHEHIAELQEVIVGEKNVYAFFAHHHGDLHSYVRSARRLKDTEAANLFAQIASVVAHCHEAGVVLRDLKLRKFVFKDAEK
jgi:serine/threonine protein kinase